MANSRLPEGTVEVALRHDRRDRPYLLRAPAAGAMPAPLVLEIHGRGIDAGMFDRWTGYSALADEAGFVLAMPRAVGQIWNDGRYGGRRWPEHDAIDDVGYLVAVVDDVARRHLIDPTRIYAVGMSNGATMAGRLAWERAERIAAIAQVAGTAAVAIAGREHPRIPVPLIQIHGTHDRSMPYRGGRASLWMRMLVGRPASPVLGVDEWAHRWVERNEAPDDPDAETIGPDVTVRRWRGKTAASDIDFYCVAGGGHTWPGARLRLPPHLGRMSRTIDATRLTWAFLSTHRRDA